MNISAWILIHLLTPYKSVNPLYYVTFTTATLCASFILFAGFNTRDPVNTLSLLCGFLVTFTGVYLLNLSRNDPHGTGGRRETDATGTDMVSSFQTRLSMQARRSSVSVGHSLESHRGDRQGLIHAYDAEEAAGFGLTDFVEESDDSSARPNGATNGRPMYGGPNDHENGRRRSELR